MDPKEQLKKLEEETIKKCLEKLADMVEKHEDKAFLKKNELHHLSETVKLCHQVRSLLS